MTGASGALGEAGIVPGWAWPPLRLADLWIFAVVGISGSFGQFFLNQAFRYGEVSMLAPIEYWSESNISKPCWLSSYLSRPTPAEALSSIAALTAGYRTLALEDVVHDTMNGNRASGFQWLGSKSGAQTPLAGVQ